MITTEIGKNLMVLDEQTGEVHNLNATARLIFELLKDGKTDEEIAEAVHEQFEVPDEADVAKDIGACRKLLEEKGIL